MKNQEAFTYCWTDHRDNKLYVGYHKGRQGDGYVCSSKWVLEEYKKRPQDFTRQIIAEGTAEDCFKLEHEILKIANAAFSSNFYNKTNGGADYVLQNKNGENNPFYGKKHKESSLIKMKDAKLGKKHSKDHNKKVSESLKGHKHTEETIKKMSESKLGHIVTENTRSKISQTNMGRPSPRKGLKTPLNVRLKQSESRQKGIKEGNIVPWNKGKKGAQIPWNKGKKGVQVAWNKGIKTPIETRALQSQKAQGRTPWNKGKKAIKE